MVDIRTIRGKDKTDAYAKARVEYGSNFIILTGKNVKVGGFLGLGMKTEYELRIMLNNSIYDRKNASEEKESYEEDDNIHRNKLLSDRIEMKKHATETIDPTEMADRIVAMTKALKERSMNSKNNNNISSEPSNNNVNSFHSENNNEIDMNEVLMNNNVKENKVDSFTPLQTDFHNYGRDNFNNTSFINDNNSLFSNMRNINSLDSNYSSNQYLPNSNFINRNSNIMNRNDIYNATDNSTHYMNNNTNNTSNVNNNAIDDSVKRLVQEQIKDIVKEYLENSIPNLNLNKNNKYDNLNRFDNNVAYNESRMSGNFKDIRSRFDENAREEDDIYDALEDIKEYREEHNLKNRVRNFVREEYKSNNVEGGEIDVSDGIEESFSYLRNREFPEEALLDLREYLLTSSNARFFQSKEVIREEVEKYFNERLILSNGIDIGAKKKIIVFVGPTGVGKTTTIPKIAAQYMKSGKKVSFVTIDNYRIAAVDQLQRYAGIMKVPFTSASTPEALRAEIRKMDNSSLLFIDTMGRSPKSIEDIISMSKYFTTVGRFDMDIQLVMSATAKYKDIVKILNAFKPTNYKGVILTKVDETDYLASSICAISKRKLPITYITYGQGVPKDISTAKKYGYKIIESLFGNTI